MKHCNPYSKLFEQLFVAQHSGSACVVSGMIDKSKEQYLAFPRNNVLVSHDVGIN